MYAEERQAAIVRPGSDGGPRGGRPARPDPRRHPGDGAQGSDGSATPGTPAPRARWGDSRRRGRLGDRPGRARVGHGRGEGPDRQGCPHLASRAGRDRARRWVDDAPARRDPAARSRAHSRHQQPGHRPAPGRPQGPDRPCHRRAAAGSHAHDRRRGRAGVPEPGPPRRGLPGHQRLLDRARHDHPRQRRGRRQACFRGLGPAAHPAHRPHEVRARPLRARRRALRARRDRHGLRIPGTRPSPRSRRPAPWWCGGAILGPSAGPFPKALPPAPAASF